MRRFPFPALVARVLLTLALIAPHGATAAARDGSLTLVICGAAGPYEITLGDAPPAPHAAPHDCCVLCAPAVAPPPSAGLALAPSSAAVAGLARIGAPTRPAFGRPSPRGPPLSA